MFRMFLFLLLLLSLFLFLFSFLFLFWCSFSFLFLFVFRQAAGQEGGFPDGGRDRLLAALRDQPVDESFARIGSLVRELTASRGAPVRLWVFDRHGSPSANAWAQRSQARQWTRHAEAGRGSPRGGGGGETARSQVSRASIASSQAGLAATMVAESPKFKVCRLFRRAIA